MHSRQTKTKTSPKTKPVDTTAMPDYSALQEKNVKMLARNKIDDFRAGSKGGSKVIMSRNQTIFKEGGLQSQTAITPF